MKLSVRLRGKQNSPRKHHRLSEGNFIDNEKKTISFEYKNMKELPNFLEANKDSYHEIWVVLTKKERVSPQPVSFHEAQTEAMKQGLVDSRSKSLNDEKYCVRFTKRRIENQ
jgi:hypothetical protein